MSVVLDAYETRVPDADGWRGFPFRHPGDEGVTVLATDGGRHDGGPMPPEAPRDPAPAPKDGGGK